MPIAFRLLRNDAILPSHTRNLLLPSYTPTTHPETLSRFRIRADSVSSEPSTTSSPASTSPASSSARSSSSSDISVSSRSNSVSVSPSSSSMSSSSPASSSRRSSSSITRSSSSAKPPISSSSSAHPSSQIPSSSVTRPQLFFPTTPATVGNAGGGTPFARNVGGIVGVAIGALVAIVVGGILLFLVCRQFSPRRRNTRRTRELELSAAGVDLDRLDGARSPHYSLRRGGVASPPRPPMPNAPASSSSVAALLARFRRRSSMRTPQSERFEGGTNAIAGTPPLAPAPIAIPPQSTILDNASPTSATFSPIVAPSPRPGSLLNPRQYPDSDPRPLSPPPLAPWLAQPGDATPPASQPVGEGERVGTPQGLLRPSLATLQHPSFMDHVDYSRPISGRIALRANSEQTITTPELELGPLISNADELPGHHAL
ncbi:hypothetical protein MIND_00019800 [Mycena indigotica]|uniref:Uncharacterized protein n=1 Tax=Mycena indigotica TaxID=2126181 RepID=A0A8H6TE34_9AGAR|nr:uncharacterized protein MIND_00019800 [Mycena indigotica]KAF7315056.1 hypothetical protein MIND_00019800 [Mycena indigotica]